MLGDDVDDFSRKVRNLDVLRSKKSAVDIGERGKRGVVFVARSAFLRLNKFRDFETCRGRQTGYVFQVPFSRPPRFGIPAVSPYLKSLSKLHALFINKERISAFELMSNNTDMGRFPILPVFSYAMMKMTTFLKHY